MESYRLPSAGPGPPAEGRFVYAATDPPKKQNSSRTRRKYKSSRAAGWFNWTWRGARRSAPPDKLSSVAARPGLFGGGLRGWGAGEDRGRRKPRGYRAAPRAAIKRTRVCDAALPRGPHMPRRVPDRTNDAETLIVIRADALHE